MRGRRGGRWLLRRSFAGAPGESGGSCGEWFERHGHGVLLVGLLVRRAGRVEFGGACSGLRSGGGMGLRRCFRLGLGLRLQHRRRRRQSHPGPDSSHSPTPAPHLPPPTQERVTAPLHQAKVPDV